MDNGQSFSDISTINNNAINDVVGPSSALSSNNTLFVAWTGYNGSNYNGGVFYAHSTNRGLTFSYNSALYSINEYEIYTPYSYKTTFPVIKFDSKDRLYILYSKYRNNNSMQIFLSYSDDFGLHWSSPIPIDQTPNSVQWEADMAIDSYDNVHIAWLEQSNYEFKPFYREVSFSGVIRSVLNMTSIIPIADKYTLSKFERPGDYLTLRLDSNNVPHVVWTDGRSGSLDIYYAYLLTNSKSKSSPGFTFIALFATIPIVLVRKRYFRKVSIELKP